MTTVNDEFKRWREAPTDRRGAIARQQFLHVAFPPIWSRLLQLPTSELREIVAPNGKRLGECTSAEFAEMAAWSRALRRAGKEVGEAIRLSHLGTIGTRRLTI